MKLHGQRLARRYAHALGMLAKERDVLNEVERDMELVQQLLHDSDEFRVFLQNEQVPAGQRCEFLESTFQGKIDEVSLNFLKLVVYKHRVWYLSDMIDAFIEYANEQRGIIVVRVTSAKELGDMMAQQLAAGLGKSLDAEVRVRTFIDASLLGGVTVQVDDLLIDGSALTRLSRLGQSLRSAQLN